jgi:hypothetical protein
MANKNEHKFVELWINHNRFSWEQVRVLPFVEAAILAGAYALYRDAELLLAAIVLVFGTLVLFLLFLLLCRHFQHLKAFRDAAGRAIPKPDEPLFCLHSDWIAKWLPVLLIVLNLVLLGVGWYQKMGLTCASS